MSFYLVVSSTAAVVMDDPGPAVMVTWQVVTAAAVVEAGS